MTMTSPCQNPVYGAMTASSHFICYYKCVLSFCVAFTSSINHQNSLHSPYFASSTPVLLHPLASLLHPPKFCFILQFCFTPTVLLHITVFASPTTVLLHPPQFCFTLTVLLHTTVFASPTTVLLHPAQFCFTPTVLLHPHSFASPTTVLLPYFATDGKMFRGI